MLLTKEDIEAFVNDYHFHEIECARSEWDLDYAVDLVKKFYAFLGSPVQKKYLEIKKEYYERWIDLMYHNGSKKWLYFVPISVHDNWEVEFHIKKII